MGCPRAQVAARPPVIWTRMDGLGGPPRRRPGAGGPLRRISNIFYASDEPKTGLEN